MLQSSSTSSFRFVLVFLALTGGLACSFLIGTEWLVRQKVVPVHNIYKHADLFSETDQVNVIFGDSHMAYGITGLEGFVNLSYGGQNIQTILGKLQIFFEQRPVGDVILQAGVHHFSRDFMDGRSDETLIFADLLAGSPPLKFFMFSPFHRNELLEYWKVLVDGRTFDPQLKFQPDGSQLSNKVIDLGDNQKGRAARVANILTPVKGFTETKAAASYRDAIMYVLNRGGRVCLVTPPLIADTARRLMASEMGQQGVAFFEKLSSEFSIRYVNFLEHDLSYEFFSDPHHLNKTGALAISPIVKEACF